MIRQPIVSVLMTAYNREKYIAESIEHVLDSVFTDFELIIVDDCSSDGTVEIARSYAAKDTRIKVYVNEKNLGDYYNRNKAATFANGKYIKYVDSDDIMYPYCLYMMVTSMEKYPDAGFGLCSIASPSTYYPVCLSPREAYLEHFNGYGHFERAPGSAIIRKDAFDKVGGFTGKRMIGDCELWHIMSRYYPMVKLPRELVWDRKHEGSETNSDYGKKSKTLIHNVMVDALNHPDCPLSKDEIAIILKRKRRKSIEEKVIGKVYKAVKKLR